MSLLYEHYVLGALRKAYGPKILYQAKAATGYPDFLFKDTSQPMILDTKYKLRYDGAGKPCTDDIRQLAGYARDRCVLRKLGVVEKEAQDASIIPCVIIYPGVEGELSREGPIEGAKTPKEQAREADGLVGFHFMRVALPRISQASSDQGISREAICRESAP